MRLLSLWSLIDLSTYLLLASMTLGCGSSIIEIKKTDLFNINSVQKCGDGKTEKNSENRIEYKPGRGKHPEVMLTLNRCIGLNGVSSSFRLGHIFTVHCNKGNKDLDRCKERGYRLDEIKISPRVKMTVHLEASGAVCKAFGLRIEKEPCERLGPSRKCARCKHLGLKLEIKDIKSVSKDTPFITYERVRDSNLNRSTDGSEKEPEPKNSKPAQSEPAESKRPKQSIGQPPRKPTISPSPPPQKTKLNWLVIYDNSTESTFKGKSASIEALTKTTLNFNYGFVVNASNIDRADNRNRVIHELNLKAPERGHLNLLQSHQAIRKRHKELEKQELNAFVYIGYDALATKDSKLDKFNPLLKHAKQRVYLILDEEGRCLRSKAPHQDPSKFSSSEQRKVSCLKPSQIIRYLDRLPNEL